MRSASYSPASDRQRGPLGRRSIALLVTLAVHVLLLIVLLSLAPPQVILRPVDKIFRLLPATEDRVAAKPAPHGRKPKATRTAAGGAAPRPPVPKAAAETPAPPLNLVPITREDFAASNIASLPHPTSAAPTQGAGGTASGPDSGAAEGAGEAPGGERLYNAQWYGKPPGSAELAFYMPKNFHQSGWGEVACRMVANYHVEDCRELAESPSGSGLSRTLRQAAWQFRVIPSRLGSRPMIGAWVRIHFSWTELPAEK